MISRLIYSNHSNGKPLQWQTEWYFQMKINMEPKKQKTWTYTDSCQDEILLISTRYDQQLLKYPHRQQHYRQKVELKDATLTQFKTNNGYTRESTHHSDGILSTVSFMFSSKTDGAQAHADVSDSLRQSLMQYRMHQNGKCYNVWNQTMWKSYVKCSSRQSKYSWHEKYIHFFMKFILSVLSTFKQPKWIYFKVLRLQYHRELR